MFYLRRRTTWSTGIDTGVGIDIRIRIRIGSRCYCVCAVRTWLGGKAGSLCRMSTRSFCSSRWRRRLRALRRGQGAVKGRITSMHLVR